MGNAMYKLNAGVVSAAYREHSDMAGDANFSFANSSGNLVINNNGTAGDGLLIVVFDKQYVIENNVYMECGVIVNLSTPSGLAFIRSSYDGYYDYESLVDFPDHSGFVLKGSEYGVSTAIASNFEVRKVYGLDIKNADRYNDGVKTVDNYEDADGNPKTINDFTSDYVTVWFGFSSNGLYSRIMTHDTIVIKNLVTDELLFTIDVASITPELTDTIHDYGKFDVPTPKVRIRNLRHVLSSTWVRDRTTKYNASPMSKALVVAYLEGNIENDADTEYTLSALGTDEITYDTGKYGQCYSATAHNSIQASDDIKAVLNNDLSMSCWFKYNSNGLSPNPQWRRIMWYSDNSRYVGFEIEYISSVTTNKLMLVGGNVGGSNPATAGTYNDGNWHFVVLRKSGTTLSALIDNSILLSTSTTLTGTIDVAPTISASTPDYPLNGYIDQWCVWDYALSTAECTALYNNTGAWRRVNL